MLLQLSRSPISPPLFCGSTTTKDIRDNATDDYCLQWWTASIRLTASTNSQKPQSISQDDAVEDKQRYNERLTSKGYRFPVSTECLCWQRLHSTNSTWAASAGDYFPLFCLINDGRCLHAYSPDRTQKHSTTRKHFALLNVNQLCSIKWHTVTVFHEDNHHIM